MAKRLLLLNGLAIVGVILFHATGFGFTAMFAWTHRYRPVTVPNYDQAGTVAYYALRLMEQFVAFCIPAFLFVSGYFVSVLTGRTRRTVGPQAVGARIRSLLPPYLFWSAVVLFGLVLEGRIFSGGRYLRFLLTGASNPNYYYVPLLVQLYLLAPGLVLLARWNWKALLAITGTVQVCVYALQYPIVVGVHAPLAAWAEAALPKWFFVVHLFWFTFGIVAGFQHQAFKAALDRWKRILPFAVVVFFVLGVMEWEWLLWWSDSPWRENRLTLIDGLYAGSLILFFLAHADLPVPLSDTFIELGTRSYGIYLAHGVVMEYFARGVYHVAPWLLGRQVLFQPMLIVLGLSVPVILMRMLSRSPFRAVYAYVFG